MEYDYLIVGAGIAGLHCALRISKAFPKAKIVITEMYNYTGGRIFTYKGHGQRWEGGAGRIHKSHTMVMKYMKEYDLTLIPISDTAEWITEGSVPEKDIWPSISKMLVSALERVDPNVLATHTVEELYQPLSRFPYKSEVSTLRADLALKSFKDEMGTNSDFYVVKEGFSELTDRMKETLVKRGVTFLYNHRLISVNPFYFETKKKYVTIKAKKGILAIHSEALKNISQFKNLPVLKKIEMTPLLRTYGVFKEHPIIKRTITDSPIRHIIPINKHTIMTSYTDGKDTRVWKKIYDKGGDNALGPAIMTSLRKLLDIPDPIFFKSHYWKYGCSYWLPGLYDPKEESYTVMSSTRLPNIFVCGESYSLKQAWVEGALEHADQMLERYIL